MIGDGIRQLVFGLNKLNITASSLNLFNNALLNIYWHGIKIESSKFMDVQEAFVRKEFPARKRLEDLLFQKVSLTIWIDLHVNESSVSREIIWWKVVHGTGGYWQTWFLPRQLVICINKVDGISMHNIIVISEKSLTTVQCRALLRF